MTCKSAYAYNCMLSKIKLACLNLNYNFCPKFVMIDFKRGVMTMTTYKSIWKDIIMLVCNFHFGQCQWIAFCDYGLKIDYKTNENLQFCFRKNLAFAFLPLDKIDVYLSIIDEAYEIFDKKLDDSYIDYF